MRGELVETVTIPCESGKLAEAGRILDGFESQRRSERTEFAATFAVQEARLLCAGSARRGPLCRRARSRIGMSSREPLLAEARETFELLEARPWLEPAGQLAPHGEPEAVAAQ